MSILVVMEQREGQWNKMSFETLAAAQQFAGELGIPANAAVLGDSVATLAGELGAKQLQKVFAVEHPLLKEYTPEGYSKALRQLIEREKPTLVLFPHTYQVRDFIPKLATSLGKVAVSDVVSHHIENGQIVFVRQLFQGKVNVDVRFAGEGPHFASLQAGAFRADQLAAGSAPVENFSPELQASDIRTKALERFRESQRAVDLGAAEIIVSVGRGIKEADNIPVVQKLADALGAELAASRPICDAGWLPMERQVGSSGQTVAPKMYVAVGISGAIQHLVGMKGSRTVVAINKDPNAPIFEIADYGIVGDLFEIVPALVAAIEKAK
ncbi:MAG TPA: electron transfer flavoprotein subunit alpha/FixB family protein [Bryobacteraceae bacterium]|jgi:electron transfer flavoprotein alpha subunit|nr:electron transfer flavoprotein subunit alpha/FixB family protein [Bryobacteraceae bacterium]